MKATLRLFLAILCLFSIQKAFADCSQDTSGFYVGGFGAANWLHLTDKNQERFDYRARSKTGYLVTGALGYRLSTCFRAEGEVGYQSNSVHLDYRSLPISSHTRKKQISYMGNAYYDFLGDAPLKPYVGIGLGYVQAHITDKPNNYDNRQSGFTGQGMLGIAYSLCLKNYVSLEYRIMAAPDSTYDHSMGLSLRHLF